MNKLWNFPNKYHDIIEFIIKASVPIWCSSEKWWESRSHIISSKKIIDLLAWYFSKHFFVRTCWIHSLSEPIQSLSLTIIVVLKNFHYKIAATNFHFEFKIMIFSRISDWRKIIDWLFNYVIRFCRLFFGSDSTRCMKWEFIKHDKYVFIWSYEQWRFYFFVKNQTTVFT